MGTLPKKRKHEFINILQGTNLFQMSTLSIRELYLALSILICFNKILYITYLTRLDISQTITFTRFLFLKVYFSFVFDKKKTLVRNKKKKKKKKKSGPEKKKKKKKKKKS